MQLIIALVEPARPANVGAVARAIKTTGAGQLALVNSTLHQHEEARWLAHGATDVLDNALLFADLAALRAHCDLLIGTTARERGASRHYHTPEALAAQLASQQQSVQCAALLFGREASGLTNEELALCDLWSYIPLAVEFPSLNLAQAAMLYCHALGQALGTAVRQLGLPTTAADSGQLQHLLQRVSTLLDQQAPDCDDKVREWLTERLPCLSDRDVRMAHQLLNRLFGR